MVKPIKNYILLLIRGDKLVKIVIIRHGEPDYENNTLTPNGFKEAKALAKYLKNIKVDAWYTSPLPRAKLTSEEVLKPRKKEAVVLPWLKEFSHYVDVPYKSEKQINWDFLPSYFTKNDDFYDNNKYLDSKVMKSGNVKEYYMEVVAEFDKLLETHGYKREGRTYKVLKSNKDTIVLFCHFGVMSVLMSRLINVPYIVLAQYFVCLPTGITTFVSEEREQGIAQFRCLQYGSLSHLEMENIKPSFHARFCETFDSKEIH